MSQKKHSAGSGRVLRFLLRKTWILTWDNIGMVLLVNVSFTLLGALILIVARSVTDSYAGLAVVLSAGTVPLTWYLRSVHLFMRQLVSFGTADARFFFRCLKSALRKIAVPGIFFFFYALFLLIGLPFYLSTRSFGGYLGAAIIFWIYVVTFPAVIMLLPLLTGGKGEPMALLTAIKKSLRLLFTEPKTMIVLASNAAGFFVISVFTGFFLPGIASVVMLTESAGMLLANDPGLRLERIAGEEERMGKRSLKGFIFPWKG